MCFFFHRRKQERIARQIAEKYDMLHSYRTARHAGLSPIEALEEWDLLDEEAIKKLNEE